MTRKMEVPPCPLCGTQFETIFDATDHLVEEGGQEIFDPVFTLSNGFGLMIGSLLRSLYFHANNPDKIKYVTQETYATLYAAVASPDSMRNLVEDIIVTEQMEDIDLELRKLLRKSKDDK